VIFTWWVGSNEDPLESLVWLNKLRNINLTNEMLSFKGTNKWDAIETVERLVQDVVEGKLKAKGALSDQSIYNLLAKNKFDVGHVVNYKDWKRLDSFEVEKGKLIGKPREKVLTQSNMLNIIRQPS